MADDYQRAQRLESMTIGTIDFIDGKIFPQQCQVEIHMV
jgi:hypothetical protein